MKIEKNNQGSLMIGSLFMMLIISAASIAIINRSMHGATLAGDSKKGYSAYQVSDSNAEDFLNNLKNLDKEPNTNRIPENTAFDIADFCPADGKTTCLDSSSNPVSAGSKVADVSKIEGEGDAQGLSRKIQLDISDRVNSGLGNNDFEVEACGDGVAPCTYNECDIKISLTPSSDAAIRDKIKGYEVRRSIQGPGGGELNDTAYGWRMADSFVSINAKTDHILKNGDAFAGAGGQYGKDYYFTVKALNENPLSLDSLYLSNGAGKSNKKVTMPGGATCPGCESNPKFLSGLGCTPVHPDPAKAETVKVQNACCGGEYYQCKAGYDAVPSRDSCVATCTPTCSTGPGCRASLVDGQVAAVGNCCGTSCYECKSGYIWDSGSGTCCQNECSFIGQQECADGSSTKTCGNYDADSCLEWSSPTSCTYPWSVCMYNQCCYVWTGQLAYTLYDQLCYINGCACGHVNIDYVYQCNSTVSPVPSGPCIENGPGQCAVTCP